MKVVFTKLLLEFCGIESTSVLCMCWKWCTHQLTVAALAFYKPSSDKYFLSTSTRTNIPTIISEAGVGGGNELVRQAGRISRAEYKQQTYENKLQMHRNKLLKNGIYCCTHRCPETRRYCTKQFLKKIFFTKHVLHQKCTFPKGIRSCDKLIYTAVQPGSTLCHGSHYNRGYNT